MTETAVPRETTVIFTLDKSSIIKWMCKGLVDNGLLAVQGAIPSRFLYTSKQDTCSALVSFANPLLVIERQPLWVTPLHLVISSLRLYYEFRCFFLVGVI